MAAHQSSQDRILFQLKKLGPQTVKQIADKLAMTTMGVRQHLSSLDQGNLVSQTGALNQGRGRPVRRWKLTASGHKEFPDTHAQVTSDLIASVREIFGEDGMQQLIAKRTKDAERTYKKALKNCKDVRSMVVRLAELRSEEGYMAECFSEGDGLLLAENHCPICVAATECQGFCQSELETFQRLFEGKATVRRSEHLLKGARRCSYLIDPLD